MIRMPSSPIGDTATFTLRLLLLLFALVIAPATSTATGFYVTQLLSLSNNTTPSSSSSLCPLTTLDARVFAAGASQEATQPGVWTAAAYPTHQTLFYLFTVTPGANNTMSVTMNWNCQQANTKQCDITEVTFAVTVEGACIVGNSTGDVYIFSSLALGSCVLGGSNATLGPQLAAGTYMEFLVEGSDPNNDVACGIDGLSGGIGYVLFVLYNLNGSCLVEPRVQSQGSYAARGDGTYLYLYIWNSKECLNAPQISYQLPLGVCQSLSPLKTAVVTNYIPCNPIAEPEINPTYQTWAIVTVSLSAVLSIAIIIGAYYYRVRQGNYDML